MNSTYNIGQMDITHETYSAFLTELRCDDESTNNKWDVIHNSKLTYHVMIQPHLQQIRQFDLKWFQETDLMLTDMFDQESVNEITTQGIDKIAFYCFELFEKIQTQIELSPNNTALTAEFEIYKKNYETMYNSIFAEIEYKKSMLNIFNELLTTTFDWIIVYCATQYSSELFKIILQECGILTSIISMDLLTRKIVGHNSLILRTAMSHNFKPFVELVGKQKMIELMFNDAQILLFVINKRLIVDIITSDVEEEQIALTNTILAKRYENGDTFMHVVLCSVFDDEYIALELLNLMIALKPYSSLIDEPNNNGLCAYYFCSYKTKLMNRMLIENKIISLTHLLKICDGNLPLMYYCDIAKLIFDQLTSNIVTPESTFNLDKESLVHFVPNLIFYMYNKMRDEENFDGGYQTIDENYNVATIVQNFVNKLDCLENMEDFLFTEMPYYNGKSYPIIYYLFSIGIQEKIFTLQIDNKLHIAFESILQKYPFLLPGQNIIVDIDIECIETVKKLVQFGQTNYLQQYFKQILDSTNLFDEYLSDAVKLDFLNNSLMLLNTTIAPYNIMKIFSDFANNVTTPSSTIDSLDDITFVTLIKNAFNMYINRNTLLSCYIAKPLFEWAFQFNSELFCSTLALQYTWPKFFTNVKIENDPLIGSELFTFIVETILKQTKVTHESIFGTNIDDFPAIFTSYSDECSVVYDKLIECGHLDTYYSQNFSQMYNLLCLRDVKITNALKKLPNFSSTVFYESYENDEDIFRQGYSHCDPLYCTYLLEQCEPSLEYKQDFVKTLDLTKFPELICILLQKGIIGYKSYSSIDEYSNTMTILMSTMKDQIISYMSNFNVNEINNVFTLDVCSNILTLFVASGRECVNIVINQLQSSEEFRNMIKTYDNVLANSLDNSMTNLELLSVLLQHNIFSKHHIVIFLEKIIIKNTNLFQKVLDTCNIIDLLEEEELILPIDNVGMENSFLLKIFDIPDSFDCLLNWASNKENYDNINMIIAYCHGKNLDLLAKFIDLYELTKTEQFVQLFLATNYSLITNVMISELIILDKKDLIVQCVKFKVSVNICNLNAIIEKYPDSVLLFENTKELVLQMSDSNVASLFKSPCMTADIQDFVMEYLLSLQKLNVMCECILNTQIQSHFIESRHDIISKLIEIDNEVFYSLMKNGICVDLYLLTMDQNGNYMLPFIPDGYVSETIVEKFILALSLEDLNKCDNFGRSVFNNFVVNPFLKFVLARPDINEFYEKNLQTLKLLINNISINHYESLQEFPLHIKNKIVNQKGQNILMILMEAGKCNDAVDYINNDADHQNFEHKDNNGCNLLFYAVLQPDIFDDVLKIYVRDYGDDCVKAHNENCETLLMYAIKHGAHNSSFEILLSNDKFGKEQNYVYKNSGSILTYGAMYLNDRQFETLIAWPHISGNHLDVTQNFEVYDWFSGNDPLTSKTLVRGSLLTIVAFYSGHALKKLLKYYEHQLRSIITILSKEKILVGTASYSPIEFAYLYTPESFQHLLGLSIINELVNHRFFSKNYNVQPASWFYYTQSKIYTNTIPDLYKLSYCLRPGSHINSIASIVQAKQECGTSLIDTCNICNVGKKKIMFGCHLHLACVKCGCTIEKCPECGNKEHTKKIKVFD